MTEKQRIVSSVAIAALISISSYGLYQLIAPASQELNPSSLEKAVTSDHPTQQGEVTPIVRSNTLDSPLTDTAQRSPARSDTSEPVVMVKTSQKSISRKYTNTPMADVLDDLEKELSIMMYPDFDTSTHYISATLNQADPQQAMAILWKDYSYTLLYSGEKLIAMGLYSKQDSQLAEAALFHKTPSSLAQKEVTDPVDSARQQILAATPEAAMEKFSKGIDSRDENIRAATLLGASDRELKVPAPQLRQLALSDDSPLVRSIAFGEILASEQFDRDMRDEIAYQLSSDSDMEIQEQALEYLSYLDNGEDSARIGILENKDLP